jgi:hypothetical protein
MDMKETRLQKLEKLGLLGAIKHSDFNSENYSSHPWQSFLNARRNCIDWLKNERQLNNKQIAETLSMDEEQVYRIIKADQSLEDLVKQAQDLGFYS